MSWDTTACFKAMCTAFSDFQRQPSEQTLQDLQRQIDVILGVTSHGATLNEFTPKQLVYAETLSGLVSIINEPNLKNSLYLKTLMALSQLANDLETKLSLQNDFNLAASMVGFILNHPANTANKQMILQALHLLEKMTYGISCTINNIYMVDLIKQLVKSIYSTASEFCMPSLSVLANLSRNNENVKSFVRTMSDSKQFVKVLLSYLSNANKTFSITSLSILTSLYLSETFGETMFSGHNLINMIRLAFKVLISNDDVTTRHFSIDLIIDFVRCEKTLSVINESGIMESDMYKILNLLHTTDARTAIKIFELLIEFCQQPCLCNKVHYVFFKDYSAVETQLPDQVMFHPAQSLLHWISRGENEDTIIRANILSLIFLKHLFIISAGNINQISVYASQVFPVLLQFLQLDVINLQDLKQIKQRFRKLATVFEIFSTLCKDCDMKDVVKDQVEFGEIFTLITKVLEKYSDDLNAMRDPAMHSCQEIIFLVFQGLELLSMLKHHFDSGLVMYNSLIQNVKLIPLLSHAIGSNLKYLVHASLQIIAEGLKVKDFQSKALGDTLIFHNSARLKEHVMPPEILENPPKGSSKKLREITNTGGKNTNFPQDTATISMLTERLKKGLDIKDSKVSDIMEFYEQKLSALIGRENHIQDLLEAKSTTLSQTERLLSQYRCRHAQSEAECLKLRSMLQKSEKNNETYTIKLHESEKAKKKLDAEIVTLRDRVKSLDVVAAEYEELKIIYEEQSQKLESVQKSLQSAEEEHNSLVSMNECLMKNGEMLKTKLDIANERLSEMEEEKQNLLGEIKEREKEKKKLEKSLKESINKVKSSEAKCQELEATISEKENAVSHLQTELEKQSQISAMIHNLTMGKINLPTTSDTSR